MVHIAYGLCDPQSRSGWCEEEVSSSRLSLGVIITDLPQLAFYTRKRLFSKIKIKIPYIKEPTNKT